MQKVFQEIQSAKKKVIWTLKNIIVIHSYIFSFNLTYMIFYQATRWIDKYINENNLHTTLIHDHNSFLN